MFKYAGEGLDIHDFVPTESPLSGAFQQPASPATPSTDATIEVRGESTSPIQSSPRAFQSPPSYKRRVRETHSVPNSLASQGTPIQTTDSDIQQHLSPRILHRNDFDPIKHLGKGCFGDVWLVFDTVSKRHLAMKIINKANKAADVYGLIFEEQRIGREVVGSKWLLPIEGSFEDEENFYTLMVCRCLLVIGVPCSHLVRNLPQEEISILESTTMVRYLRGHLHLSCQKWSSPWKKCTSRGEYTGT